MQAGAIAGLHEQLRTMAAGAALHGRGNRAQQFDAGAILRGQQAFGFAAEYSVTGEKGTVVLGSTDFPQCLQQCLPSLIDSGAPSTSVRLPGITPPYPYEADGGLAPGTEFTATFPTTQGRPQLRWTFVAGNDGSVNEVNYSTAGGAAESTQNVNTGLNIYNDFDVMFDVRSQVIWLRPSWEVLAWVTRTRVPSLARTM